MLTGVGECPVGSARKYKIIGRALLSTSIVSIDTLEIEKLPYLVRELSICYRPDRTSWLALGELEIKSDLTDIKKE